MGVTVDDERSDDLLTNDDSEDGDVHFLEGEIRLQLTEDSNASLDIEEIVAEAQEPLFVDKHCSTMEVDGKSYYKVSLVKEYLNSDSRLRRVRGYSKYPEIQDGQEEDDNLDDMVMIGDLAAGKVIMDDGAASMCIAKISSLRQKSSAKYITYAPSHCIGELQTGKVLGGSVINVILILKPGNRCEEVI